MLAVVLISYVDRDHTVAHTSFSCQFRSVTPGESTRKNFTNYLTSPHTPFLLLFRENESSLFIPNVSQSGKSYLFIEMLINTSENTY